MAEIRTSIIKNASRFGVTNNQIDGIVNYDIDNCYPQRVADIVQGSAVASKCVDVYTKFIAGQGFEDKQFYKKHTNPQKQTPDILLRKTAHDYALHRGFALHINYNANFKISSISHIPFEHCRLGIPDELNYIRKIAIYNDWGRKRSRQIRKDNIDHIDIYNPDPTAIKAQVEAAGGWDKYKGQVYWYSADGNEYPRATADAVLEDCITDSEIKTYKWRAISTNFMASHIYVHRGYFENDESRMDLHTVLNSFQGSDNVGKIMMVESPGEESDPKLLKVDVQNFDKHFEYTEQSVQDNIRLCFGIPSVLIGKEVAGKLGNSQEIEQAVNYYSYQTLNERLIMEEVFSELFSMFATPINPSNNYAIKPLSYAPTTLGN